MQAAHTPIYVSMISAWSLAEITRYLHYATSLASVKLPGLEWIRYSAFYVLYPLGAGSEAWLMLRAAPLAGEQYGEAAKYAVYALTAVWPPALFVLMSHMTVQRRKYLGKSNATASASTSASTPVRRSARNANTAVAAFVPKVEHAAAAVAEVVKAPTISTKPKSSTASARSASPVRRSARSSLAGSPAPQSAPTPAAPASPARSTRSRSKPPQ